MSTPFQDFEVSMLRDQLCFKLRYIVSCVGVQQKELAAELGIDQGNLSKILNSKFNFGVDSLLKIVDALGFELSITINPPVEIPVDATLSDMDEQFKAFE